MEGRPTVLVLTPVKQAAAHLPLYFELLSRLDYPPDRLSIGILEGDSTDVPELVGVPRGKLILVNDDDLTYCSLRLDRDSLDTLVGRIGDKVGNPRGWFAASVAGNAIVALNPPADAMGGTPGDPVSRLQWVDRTGRVVGELGTPARYWTMRLSMNGLAAIVNPDTYVWAIDARSQLKTRIAFASGGLWMPDGRTVLYRDDAGLLIKSASGEGETRSILKFTKRVLVPTSVSRDGTRLAVTARTGSGSPSLDVWLLKVADGSTQPLLSTEYDEAQPSLSPDDKWLAYASNQTGRYEVWIEPFPRTGTRYQVTRDGGSHPLWRPDGRSLYFDRDHQMFEVAVNTQDMSSRNEPRPLPIKGFVQAEYRRQFDLMPDGRRFLVLLPKD